jgi:hypothetical protein
MPSMYLAPSDLTTYGVTNATTAQILEASLLLDAYLKRPEGLMWMPDSIGQPCYTAGLSSPTSFPVSGGIAAGQNVVVPLPTGLQLSITGQLGNVVILDRASATQGQAGLVEACVIGSMTSTSITLKNVANTHAAGVVVEFGLTIREQRTLPQKRSIARLGSWPIARVHSGLGSYRYGRRDDQQGGLYADQSVLALMQTFGGPPEWIPFDVTAGDWSDITNEVWIPSGVFLAYYSDVRIYYVAGFSQANIPSLVKQVVASIIKAKINTSDLTGGVKMARAGDSAIMRFENSVLDADTREMLAPYRARLLV